MYPCHIIRFHQPPADCTAIYRVHFAIASTLLPFPSSSFLSHVFSFPLPTFSSNNLPICNPKKEMMQVKLLLSFHPLKLHTVCSSTHFSEQYEGIIESEGNHRWNNHTILLSDIFRCYHEPSISSLLRSINLHHFHFRMLSPYTHNFVW